MARMFGTDGVRGVANKDLSCELALKIGKAGAYVLTNEVHQPRILLGRDTRLSGDMLSAALTAGICSVGGDVIEKDLVKNVDKLHALGFEITLHDKMPDVVLYAEDKDWLYFIESVTSVGPMEPKRIKEIEEMTTGVKAGKIYVTAFLDFKTFKQFSESLAWETEVWIADMPDHMIHLNGGKFLGPRI